MTAEPAPYRINAVPASVDKLLCARHGRVTELRNFGVENFRAAMVIMANWATDPEKTEAFAALTTPGSLHTHAHIPTFSAEHKALTGNELGFIDTSIMLGFIIAINYDAPVKYAGYEAALRRERGVTWNGQTPN